MRAAVGGNQGSHLWFVWAGKMPTECVLTGEQEPGGDSERETMSKMEGNRARPPASGGQVSGSGLALQGSLRIYSKEEAAAATLGGC